MMRADVGEICLPPTAGCLVFKDGRLADVNGMQVCTYTAVYIMALYFQRRIFHQV